MIIAAVRAFDREGFDGGEKFTPLAPMRHDSFVVQRPAGIHWLHVHPDYLVGPREHRVIELAVAREDGLLPKAGGHLDQPAWTMAAIDIVRDAWAKLRADRDKKRTPGR